jgi:hypothetical protein
MDQFAAGMIPGTYSAPQFNLIANVDFPLNFKEQSEFVGECRSNHATCMVCSGCAV